MSDDALPLGTNNQPEADKAPNKTTAVVEPVQVNTGRIIAFGTAAWAIALVVMLLMWSWIQRHHHQQWIWTCAVGVLLGLVGLLLVGPHRSLGRTT